MANTLIVPPPEPEEKIKHWTRQEYEHLVQIGFFTTEDRLELLEGVIVEKMPQNSPHVIVMSLLTQSLNQMFATRYHLRFQAPLDVSDDSVPEPDVAVVKGKARDYVNAHPETALLIIEVSDSTLSTDRNRKSRIYAKAGIADYWIINIPDRVLEVRRDPILMNATDSEYGYRTVTIYREDENAVPLFAPETPIAVADILP